MCKLEKYGFRGIVLKWFESFLSNRSQYVVFNNVNSDYLPITCGVPQGSVLGPMLFLLYINDIVNCTSILKLMLFADDTTINFAGNNLLNLTTVFVNSSVK